MPDVYYNPEKFGLTTVFEADDGGSYEFDIFAVWKDDYGNFYYGTDAGCSCPSPFEWATSLEDVTQASKHEIITAFEDWRGADPVSKTELFSKLFGM